MWLYDLCCWVTEDGSRCSLFRVFRNRFCPVGSAVYPVADSVESVYEVDARRGLCNK